MPAQPSQTDITIMICGAWCKTLNPALSKCCANSVPSAPIILICVHLTLRQAGKSRRRVWMTCSYLTHQKNWMTLNRYCCTSLWRSDWFRELRVGSSWQSLWSPSSRWTTHKCILSFVPYDFSCKLQTSIISLYIIQYGKSEGAIEWCNTLRHGFYRFWIWRCVSVAGCGLTVQVLWTILYSTAYTEWCKRKTSSCDQSMCWAWAQVRRGSLTKTLAADDNRSRISKTLIMSPEELKKELGTESPRL